MSKMTRAAAAIVFLFVIVFSLGQASCAIRSKVGSYYCSDLTDTIYGPSSLQFRGDDFSSYEIDKQYALYVCGMQSVHPPMMYLAELFAKEGGKAVGFLKTKLLEAKDDLTIRDLVLVFTWMSRLKSYDVANDDELMGIISERVEGMRDSGWRETTKEMVGDINK